MCLLKGIPFSDLSLPKKFSVLAQSLVRSMNTDSVIHNFDCINPLFLCGIGNEYKAHFLLPCRRCHVMRRDLFGQLSEIPGFDLTNMDSKAL